MEPKELLQYAREKVGTMYKNEPPFSLEHGFNCLYWADHLYRIFGIDPGIFEMTRQFRTKFTKLNDDIVPQFLDVPLFYLDTLGQRHVGVMLTETIMSHCSSTTNGVSIAYIDRLPWSGSLKGFYRLNEINGR